MALAGIWGCSKELGYYYKRVALRSFQIRVTPAQVLGALTEPRLKFRDQGVEENPQRLFERAAHGLF